MSLDYLGSKMKDIWDSLKGEVKGSWLVTGTFSLVGFTSVITWEDYLPNSTDIGSSLMGLPSMLYTFRSYQNSPIFSDRNPTL